MMHATCMLWLQIDSVDQQGQIQIIPVDQKFDDHIFSVCTVCSVDIHLIFNISFKLWMGEIF